MPFHFNKDNARAMAVKGAEIRRANRNKRIQADKLLRDLLENVVVVSPIKQDEHSAYLQTRLSRVRRMLDRIDECIESESDPMRLDKLTSAQSKLAEQERVLAGRPLPGTKRPEKASSVAGPPPIVEPGTE
jgi:hypothetical protein